MKVILRHVILKYQPSYIKTCIALTRPVHALRQTKETKSLSKEQHLEENGKLETFFDVF